MSHLRRILRFATSGVVLTLVAAGTAWGAPKTVVLMGCSGPHYRAADQAIQDALSSQYTVVSPEVYEKTKRRVGGRGQGNRAKVADALSATALVEGTVYRARHRWYLEVTVYDGKDGSRLGRVNERLRSLESIDRAEGELAGDLPRLVDSAQGAASASPAPVAFSAGGGTSPESEAPMGTSGATTGAAEGGGQASAATSGEVVATSSPGIQPGLDLNIGMSFLGRSFHFSSTSTMNGPQGYSGLPVGGLRLDLGAYPLALMHVGGALAGLGLGIVYDRALFISSTLKSPGVPEVKLDTTEQEAQILLRYRWTVAGDPTRPTLHFQGGWGFKEFSVAQASGVTMPSVDYQYVDLGAGVAIPVGTPSWRIVLDGAYLLVTGTGQVGDASHFGGGGEWGLDGEVGVEYRPIPSVAIRASVRYMGVFLSFNGTGLSGTSEWQSEGMPSGATDQYYGGFLTAGYLY